MKNKVNSICGKLRTYLNQRAAWRELRWLNATKYKKVNHLRSVYYCEKCTGFHLTKMGTSATMSSREKRATINHTSKACKSAEAKLFHIPALQSLRDKMKNAA